MHDINLYEIAIARIVVNALKDLGNCIGREIFISVLKGKKDNKVVKSKYYESKYYGVFASFRGAEVSNIVDNLIEVGLICKLEKGNIKYIYVADKDINFEDYSFNIISYISNNKINLISSEDEELFERLRHVRYEFAAKIGKPSFYICSDEVLRELCIKKPISLEEFSKISGIGDMFIERYGNNFLEAIIQ